MTWTYSGDPASSAKDEVRALMGDTDADTQLVTDEEVLWAITQHADQTGYGNYRAAAMIAHMIAARYSKMVSKSVGSLSINYGQRYTQYLELAKSLEAMGSSQANRKMGVPVLGGGGQTFLMGDEWK